MRKKAAIGFLCFWALLLGCRRQTLTYDCESMPLPVGTAVSEPGVALDELIQNGVEYHFSGAVLVAKHLDQEVYDAFIIDEHPQPGKVPLDQIRVCLRLDGGSRVEVLTGRVGGQDVGNVLSFTELAKNRVTKRGCAG